MNDVHSYKLVSLLDPLPKGPGFLQTVWKSGEQMYLQRLDKQMKKIQAFDPVDLADEQEYGILVPWPPKGMHHASKAARPGHNAVFAFCFPDQSSEVGGRTKLGSILRSRMPELKDFPITKLHVLEFLEDVEALPQAIEEAGEYMAQRGGLMCDQWKRERLLDVDWLRKRLQLGKPHDAEGWCEITHDFLAGRSATPEQLTHFFHGERPDWSLIRQEKLPLRTCVQNVTTGLSGQQSGAVLLLGATGEGKTTALMQIGWSWLQAGFRLFWMVDEKANPSHLLRSVTGPVALLMDDAAAKGVMDIGQVLGYANNHPAPIRLGMTARIHEWNEKYARRLTGHRFLKVEQIPRLQGTELDRIAQGVVASGGVPDLTYEVFKQRLDANKTKDLLVAMLLATDGRPLRDILRDMVGKIRAWPEDGDTLVEILAVVAGLEARTTTKGRSFPPAIDLLAELFGQLPSRLQVMIDLLTGELSLRTSGHEVTTRHILIAQTLWEILTDDPPMLDKMGLDQDIIRAGASVTRLRGRGVRETGYLTIIPDFYLKTGDVAGARELYRFASEEAPHNPFIWQNWARLETREKNLGTRETEYTARWLFNKAVTVAPNNAPTWQAWGLLEEMLEEKDGKIGSVEEPYTARWLFNRAVTVDPKHAPAWQAWGLLEKKVGNIGSVEEPYTARWLFYQGVKADPMSTPLWQVWGLLEEKNDNLGSVEIPYTARWCFEQWLRYERHEDFFEKNWSILEAATNQIHSKNHYLRLSQIMNFQHIFLKDKKYTLKKRKQYYYNVQGHSAPLLSYL
ncbi:MAG: hypothetical protein H7839_17040 [Magnetococcus sp. YQC-5]